MNLYYNITKAPDLSVGESKSGRILLLEKQLLQLLEIELGFFHIDKERGDAHYEEHVENKPDNCIADIDAAKHILADVCEGVPQNLHERNQRIDFQDERIPLGYRKNTHRNRDDNQRNRKPRKRLHKAACRFRKVAQQNLEQIVRAIDNKDDRAETEQAKVQAAFFNRRLLQTDKERRDAQDKGKVHEIIDERIQNRTGSQTH